MTEDEMVGWHHRLNRHEFEQAPGDDEGQGSLPWVPWGHKELDTTEQLNNTTNVNSKMCQRVFYVPVQPPYEADTIIVRPFLQMKTGTQRLRKLLRVTQLASGEVAMEKPSSLPWAGLGLPSFPVLPSGLPPD